MHFIGNQVNKSMIFTIDSIIVSILY